MAKLIITEKEKIEYLYNTWFYDECSLFDEYYDVFLDSCNLEGQRFVLKLDVAFIFCLNII